MDDNTYSKRALFNILGFIIIGLYIALNLSVFMANLPLMGLIIIIPIINIVLIVAWFYVRSFYNKANNKIKHAHYLELRPEERVIPTYTKANDESYVPDLIISSELFEAIETAPGSIHVLDITLKEYLRPGRFLTFHNEQEYGLIIKAKVKEAREVDGAINATFVNNPQ